MPDRLHVRLADRDLRRRRIAVLLRVPLAIPPALVLVAWSIPAAAALLVAWPATLVRGQTPRRLHHLLVGYLSAWTQLSAWLELVSGRYPRLHRRYLHPVQVHASRLQQPRLGTLFRPVLALPGAVLASVLGVVLAGTAVAAWFVAVALGRTTEGLCELGAFCLRYQVETLAFLLLVSPSAPRLEPPARTS
jgi:Domain of unknown function (DUF4389)